MVAMKGRGALAKRMAIYHRGLGRGESGTEDLIYHGVVLRIPCAEFEAAVNANDFHALWKKYEVDVDTLLVDIHNTEPLPGGIIERYEVYEQSTGDVLIMWRIPYQQKVR